MPIPWYRLKPETNRHHSYILTRPVSVLFVQSKKNRNIFRLNTHSVHVHTSRSSGWICLTHCGLGACHLFRSWLNRPCSNALLNLKFFYGIFVEIHFHYMCCKLIANSAFGVCVLIAIWLVCRIFKMHLKVCRSGELAECRSTNAARILSKPKIDTNILQSLIKI